MAAKGFKFETAFASGDVGEILQFTSREAHKLELLPLAIFAHAMSGEWATALMHCRWGLDQKIKFSAGESAMMSFALGVGHTRISEYSEARRHFAKSRSLSRESERAGFFFYQGLGFYRFFTGDFKRSAKYAARALENATQDKFTFGQMIADDLLAHSLWELGEVRLGMKHAKRALGRARELNNKSLAQSFRLMVLLNEARFGLDWECVPKLENALGKLHPRDSYSRNAVKLELANQWILRGRASQAREVLDEACDSIYASRNRRQIALLNFRLAFLTWLRGRRDEALHLLNSAELHLHKEVDAGLWKRMSGLRRRILTTNDSDISVRAAPRFGEDRIADLYSAIRHKERQALDEAITHDLLFFLYPYFDLEFNQQALFFDLLPRGLMIVDRGNLRVVQKGFSRVSRRILEALAQSHQSKAELIENVWGYNYEPARHDALVYTSISKIRQMLGSAGAWIEADEKGYRLRSGVRLNTLRAKIEPTAGRPASVSPKLTNNSLNFRQLRILAGFDNGIKEILAVDEVMRDFAVSRATATRDLSELTELGLLRRSGRARATRYERVNQ